MSVDLAQAAINPATGNAFRIASSRPARPANFEKAREALAQLAEFDQVQRDAFAAEWNLAREEGRYTSTWAYEQTGKVYSLLKELRATRRAPARETHTVPSGRYAVTGTDGATKFYRVVVSDDGFTKVQVQASSDLHEVRWNVALPVLRQIEADGIEAAAVRYGRELGRCYECGRVLTDEASREAGIGPICAAK